MVLEQKTSCKSIKLNSQSHGILELERILLASPSSWKQFGPKCKLELYIFLSLANHRVDGRDFLLVGGECFYNKMPCYFKCCVVNSRPQASKSHCVLGWGWGGAGVLADKFTINTQEGFWKAFEGGEGVLLCIR